MGRSRTYPVNERFFDEINTEAQAYWLGFLTADGYVTDRHVRVRLQGADKDHLEKFAEALESGHPIFEGMDRGNHYAEFVIGSTYMVGALARLGLSRKKSLTIQPSLQVPSPLLSHYWRGVFDGDGSLNTYTPLDRESEKWELSLVGNEYIVPSFAAFVHQELGLKGTFRVVRNSYWVMYRGVIPPQKIARLLYQNATVYLERKYTQYLILSERQLHRKNHDSVTESEVSDLYKTHRNWTKVAAELEIHPSNLAKRRKKWGW